MVWIRQVTWGQPPRLSSVSPFLAGILKERMAAQDAYATAMRRALARKPFLKTDGRYLSREETHDRSRLRYTRDPQKQQAARAWRAELWKSRRGRISFQVLQEFYVNVAQKWPAAKEDARAEVRDLMARKPVAVDSADHRARLEDPGPLPTIFLGFAHRGRSQIVVMRVLADRGLAVWPGD